jgi:predicted PurR-regulated permease PerM
MAKRAANGGDSAVSRNALVIMAVVIVGAALHWMSGIFTPLALAFFLMVMIDGFARVLHHRARLSPHWSLAVALLISAVGFGLTVYAVVSNAPAFVQQLFSAAPRLNAVIAQVAGSLGVRVPPTIQELINQLNPVTYIGAIGAALQNFASGAVYVLVYLGFLIASRAGFGKKAAALFPDVQEYEHAVSIFERVKSGMERYLWIQAVTGAMIAVACWAAMAVIGLHSSGFWAFLIFVVCFIPVLGGAVAGVLPALFALVQFDSIWPAVGLFAALQTILFVMGNYVQPRMQRDSLNIDYVVILLSLAIWGAIWGIAGMFLSTPLTQTAIILLAQFGGTRWIAILLSGDGEPEPRSLPSSPKALSPPDETPAP